MTDSGSDNSSDEEFIMTNRNAEREGNRSINRLRRIFFTKNSSSTNISNKMPDAASRSPSYRRQRVPSASEDIGKRRYNNSLIDSDGSAGASEEFFKEKVTGTVKMSTAATASGLSASHTKVPGAQQIGRNADFGDGTLNIEDLVTDVNDSVIKYNIASKVPHIELNDDQSLTDHTINIDNYNIDINGYATLIEEACKTHNITWPVTTVGGETNVEVFNKAYSQSYDSSHSQPLYYYLCSLANIYLQCILKNLNVESKRLQYMLDLKLNELKQVL